MSFAQGFAAGSAAAQRGINMGLTYKRFKEDEEYKDAMAEFNEETKRQQRAREDYEMGLLNQNPSTVNPVAASGPAGLALTSALTPDGMQSGATMPGGEFQGSVPQTPPQMSPVTATDYNPYLSDVNYRNMAEAGLAPQVRTEQDILRGRADIASQYGREGFAAQLYNQASMLDRYDQTDRRLRDFERNRNRIIEDHFDQTHRLNVKKFNLDEGQEERLAAQAERDAELHKLTMEEIRYRLNRQKQDDETADATVHGENLLLDYYRTGDLSAVMTSAETYAQGEDGKANPRIQSAVANGFFAKFYENFDGLSPGMGAMAGNKIVANLNAALEATKDYDGMSEQEFLGPFANVIADVVDPNFSDGIPTRIQQIMGEDGEPTRGYRLVHGGQVLNEFGSRKELVDFASEQRDRARTPFGQVEAFDNNRKAVTARLASIKNNQEREIAFRDAIADIVQANPTFLNDVEMQNGMRQLYQMPPVDSRMTQSTLFNDGMGAGAPLIFNSMANIQSPFVNEGEGLASSETPTETPTRTPTRTPTETSTRTPTQSSGGPLAISNDVDRRNRQSRELAELAKLQEKYPQGAETPLPETRGLSAPRYVNQRASRRAAELARLEELLQKYGDAQ